ncbi:helix-turn-helix domain-containing protein [Paenibacillus sp. PAMC21692]|uniref:helix-turn-helix domain-containing protein n=1 Tax=Paenibacillus sp. PAMC21692 TaxID=2762320 RepID=UPI00164E1B45|nr:helix-turn-helix domain-containing protein [Paenibacillus sp. PAMC21692]QNK59174.1 AraC family transcriptional regulator [Paenibacillus sp. PAMC21692]
MKANRLFYRILLYFLTLLVPLLIVSFIFYGYQTMLAKQEDSKKLVYYLQSSAKTVDLYLRSVHEVSLGLLSNKAIATVLRPHAMLTLEQRVQMSDISEMIANSENIIAEFTENIFLYVDHERIYTVGGVDDFSLFFEKFYVHQEYPVDFWKGLLERRESFEILPPTPVSINGQGKGKVIPFIAKSYVNSHDAVVAANLSESNLLKLFTDNTIFRESDFFVIDENRQLMLSSNSGLIDEHSFRQMDLAFDNHEKNYREIRLSGKKYLLAYVNSERYGWKYYSLTPLSALNQESRSTFQFIVAISVTFLILGVVFSFIFSIKIYNPIRKISEIVNGFEELDESAPYKNDFEYIGKNIKQMHDKSTQIKKHSMQISREFLDYTFYDVFMGRPVEPDTLKVLNNILRDEWLFSGNRYVCLNVWFQFSEAFYEEVQDTDRLIILSKLKNVVSALSREDTRAYVQEYNDLLFVCVVNMDEDNEKGVLDNIIQNIHATFSFDFKYCRIFIGSGRSCTELSDLRHSFNEAMTALQRRNAQEKFQVIHAEATKVENSFLYSSQEENQLINAINSGDLNAVTDNVRLIMEKNQKNNSSYQAMNGLYNEMIRTGYKLMTVKGMHYEHISMEAKTFHTSPDKLVIRNEEQYEKLIAFYAQIIEAEKDRSQNLSSIVITTMDYIQTHLEHDLYLEKISEQMGISTKYLSKIFKEQTGNNLTDYISLLRISKAKQLLIESDFSVNEVAEKVGIFNRTTFLRTFKKYEGVSPLEFKKLHEQKKDKTSPRTEKGSDG